jgi:(1->4)-alpha-D-glucan 1-alpha-D-glucosylmutase
VTRIAPAGALNALTQTALRCTLPGVPDLYQGGEFWDLSLVDPDNRRPVDYAARQSALAAGDDPLAALSHWRDGRVKQALIARLLGLRARWPDLFAEGSYEPLSVRGARANHVLAFLRRKDDRAVLIAVPRLVAGPCIARGMPLPDAGFWSDTRIADAPERDWHDLLGEASPPSLACADLFARFPVAVLT